MPDTGRPLTPQDWTYGVLEAVEAIRQAILSDPRNPVRTAEQEWHGMSRSDQARLIIATLNERADRHMVHELHRLPGGIYRAYTEDG